MAWNYRTRNSKFGNSKTNIGGRTYHSKLEANDALWLQTLEKEGTIKNLEMQKRYKVYVNDKHICDSIVDFYFEKGKTKVWYETKGFITDVYRIKRRLIEATIGQGEVYMVNSSEKEIRNLR